jgi:predicted nucleotidyltransferase
MLTIDDVKTRLSPIFLANNVAEAILFGSFAKGNQHASSDLDLVIDFKDEFDGFTFFGIKYEIEELLNMDVDLIAKFDVLPGQKLEREIKETGVVIFG